MFDYRREPGKRRTDRRYTKTQRALVSIITAYYNEEEYFWQTYNSVLNQTFPWYEWIIVNDGSTQSTEELEELCKKDQRIKLIHQENKGLAGTRNRAIRESTTDIIIPLDADDLIEPTYVEKIYFGLYFNPEASWVYMDVVGFQREEYLWRKEFDSGRMKEENLLVCTAGIRKKNLLEVGCYDEIEKEYNEDWGLWLKLLSKGHYPVHLEGYEFWYRKKQGMLNRIQQDKQKGEASKKIIKKIGENVREDIKAVEYPRATGANLFEKPKKLEWALKTTESKEKTRIMMIIPWMVMGGADLFNLEVLKKINKEKYEVSILTTVHSDNVWKSKFQDYTDEIYELPSFLDIRNYPEFISYFIQSRDIDILFLSNSYYGYHLIPWIRKEFPGLAIIDYVHMEEWYWRNGGYGRTSGMMGEILEKTYVCNEGTRKVLIDHFHRKAEDVKTLYIGVDQDKYDESKVEEGVVREKYGLGNRPIVLFPCRIHPQKRPFLMLEIAKGVKKRKKDIAFLVVGDGPQLEEMKLKSKSLGLEENVYFAGRQEDMMPYYKDATLTLICSLKEGLALTAYESVSMKTPVVSADVGGQKELIDSTVGRIIPLYQKEGEELDKREFPREETEEYVAAITDLISDKGVYEEMRENCRKRIRERFSTQIMIEELEKELEQSKAEERVAKRKRVSGLLKEVGTIAEDYLTLYTEFEAMEAQVSVVWKDVLWFKQLYENEKNKEQQVLHKLSEEVIIEDPPRIEQQGDLVSIFVEELQNYIQKSNELEHIYSMRTWKMVEKYRNFMDNTGAGKKLKSMRDLFRK